MPSNNIHGHSWWAAHWSPMSTCLWTFVLPMDIRGLCAVQHECPWTFASFDCFVDNRSYVQSRTCNLGHSLLGSIPVQRKPLSVGLLFLYQIVQDKILSLTVKKSHLVKNVDIRSYVRSLLMCPVWPVQPC